MNPLQIFQEWYEGQPEEIKSHLGMQFSMMLPRLKPLDRSEWSRLMLDNGEEMKQLFNSTGLFSVQIVGRVLALREFTTFGFSNRKTEDDWEHTADKNREILEMIADEPDTGLSETLEKVVSEMPARGKLWVVSGESWRILCNGSLSHEAIDAWLSDELHRGR